jgi:HAD superfamily hydrolase (TIGR01509 family)
VDDLQMVIFDCDGVLVDSERIANDVLARMLRAEGLPTTLEQARGNYQGLLLGEIVDAVEARLGRALPEDWVARYEQARGEVFRRELRAVPGAREAVARVGDAGVKVCVASQGKLEKTRLSLDLTGLRRLFADTALFSAHCVARGKPHPDVFLHAASRMGVEPAGCVVIEDTPSGVTAAVRAGMRVFGYAADGDAAALANAGAEVFHAHDRLPRLLGLD